MLFKKDDFGRVIDADLSDRIRRTTTVDDYVEASEMTGGLVKQSTVRDVTYRRNNLTETNSKAIEYLARIAVRKSLDLRRLIDEDIDVLVSRIGASEEDIITSVNIETIK